ncbi:Glycosyl hydrolase family 32 [Halapricum desulfuricans]|uniref:Glycosyl hydrolase family 32 n=1 Tax=Halapricum desulfuricans TaxID=2841257 RepID=A0A897NAB9_9EURY|nr:Glycosyl hydrolase family 32 [Halapricum desulfuricans]
MAPPLSPEPAAANPILTASMLGSDVEFVADPFLYLVDDWHLFVEVYRPAREPPAAIGHLRSGDRGRTWRYSGIVLNPGIHLAFPYVFDWDGHHYMLPDPWSEHPGVAADYTLYRATDFPTAWEPVATPITSDEELHDCVLLRRDGLWWALAGGGGALYAYHSRTLEADDWAPHRENPVVTGRPEAVRPAGRPIATDDGAIVFFQDCSRRYGERVWAYEVTHLTATDYRDERVGSGPVLGPAGGVGWNSGRMHHLDAWLFEDRWLCAVDGNIGLGKPVFGDHWAIGFYEQRH